MPIWTYLLVTAIGSALWNAALLGIGVAIGSNYEKVGEYVGPASRVVVVMTVLGLIAAAVYLRRRSRARAA